MNVKEIKIQEFKAIKDLNALIDGNHILLMGDNGVGKSSIIQFIEIALGKQTNIPPNATGKGEVIFDKDGKELLVKVSFKDGKPVLKITGDGIRIDNNKGAIATLFGALDFDIDEFVNQSKSKSGQKLQVEKFKSFLDKDFIAGIEKFQNNVKNDYDSRTELNKDITKLKGSIALHPLNNLPDSELKKFKAIDTTSVMDSLNKANETNQNIERIKNGITERKNKISDKEKQIEKLNEEINKLNSEKETLSKEVTDAEKWLSKNNLIDTSILQKQLSEAGEINKKALDAENLLKEREKLLKYEEESGELTAKIESSKEAINTAIREMESPIEGLSFDDETLIYNGVPVHPDSLCTSEIMELGIKLKMVENPDLGILFIQRGESLGTERLKEIKSLADSNGWQIIMEQVERGSKFHIEIMKDEA